MPARVEVAGFPTPSFEADADPVDLRPQPQIRSEPIVRISKEIDYGAIMDAISPQTRRDPLLLSRAISSGRNYQDMLQKAQIGFKDGPLFTRFLLDYDQRINAELGLMQMQNPQISESDLYEARLQKTVAREKRIEELGPVAKFNYMEAQEEIEKIKKIDTSYALALQEQFGDIPLEKPEEVEIYHQTAAA